jgi:SAM-dependent methyltransferase
LGGIESRYGYQPIDYRTFQLALKRVSIKARDGVFVDYGCGKGRAVILAARCPFRHVVGVEISDRLCATARANVDAARPRLACRNVEIIQADASEFVPPDDVSVVFMYNPFDVDVVRQVLARLRRGLLANPRDLTIVYALPKTGADILSEAEWLDREQVATDNAEWERLSIYTARPDRAAVEDSSRDDASICPPLGADSDSIGSEVDSPDTVVEFTGGPRS